MADFSGGANRDDAPGESDRDRGKCKSVIENKSMHSLLHHRVSKF